jgi:hypothetical protein
MAPPQVGRDHVSDGIIAPVLHGQGLDTGSKAGAVTVPAVKNLPFI